MFRVITFCGILVCSSSMATTHYVDINSSMATPPYTNWGTAATEIQSAVNVASSNDVVLIADGHYLLTNQISVGSTVSIQSVNGPASVVVDGNGHIDEGAISGNFRETENEYKVLVYYRNLGARYDKIIGVGAASSVLITN